MNCPQNKSVEPACGRDQVEPPLVSSEATFLALGSGIHIGSEPELEAEMDRRAGAITEVLARIMEQPKAFRHWGLNE